jgi:NAD dependent epimerase/dehydratase family
MRIFLAGASGVIGQRLIPRLVQAGHVVGGLTRSPSKTELLSHLGAEPILCDVFDREALIQAVRDFKPDVVLNELTDLPDDAARISELADLNARMRTEGTRNLIEAAQRAGRQKSWLKASPGNYLMGPMPKLSQNWSVPFSPRAVLCCAMDSSTGLARITSSNHPRNLGSTLIELPNKRWRRCVSQRALSSLSTESVTAIRPTANSFPPPPKVQLVEYLSLSRRRRAVSRVASHWHCDSRCVHPWAIRKRLRRRELSEGYEHR